MTHDELLAKINGQKNTIVGITLESEVEIQRLMKFRKALRAVVELHKPFEVNDILLCECEPLVYPCPTIKAIEKELK